MTKLGQHFLISKGIAAKMVEAAKVGPKDIILEIGPGKGILTEELLKKAGKAIAVEKDTELFNFLNQKFAKEIKSGRLILIRADIRDILKIAGYKLTSYKLQANKVIANIPYYLTGQLLRLLLDPPSKRYALHATRYVLMLQKEVAERIAAVQKLSLLAVSTQVFSEPKIAFFVSKNHFRPRPKVDSAIIILEKRPKDFFKEHKISRKKFFEIVKTGFSHPRKILKNNLKNYLQANQLQATSLRQCRISPTARAEDLTLENWACLAKNLK